VEKIVKNYVKVYDMKTRLHWWDEICIGFGWK